MIFPTSALRLVLIDDSPDDRASAIRVLQREFPNLQVQQPTNADELAQLLRFGNFDLAIVSDQVSWMNGIASIKAIKVAYPHCPVVAWTDSQSVEAAVAAMKAGADDYILKSPSQERLVAAVRELCSQEPRPIPAMPGRETQSEGKIRQRVQLLDLAIDGILVRNLDGKISDWNQGAHRLYGWTTAEAVGQEIHALLKTEFPKPFEEIQQTLLARDYWCGDLVQYKRDDAPIDVASCWTLQRDEQGNPLAVLEINRDISDRKPIEESLRESEERFRRAIIHAPIPIAIHAENYGNGEILQINNIWTELTGYTSVDIPTIGDWTEKAYGNRQLPLKRSIDRLYDLDRRVDEGEYEVRTSSGERRIWRFSSAPLGKLPDGRRAVVTMATDVTDRKQLETTLRQTILRLKNLHEIDKAILEAHSPQEIAQTAIEHLSQLLPFPRISLITFDAEQQQARFLAIHSDREISIAPGALIPLALLKDVVSQLRRGKNYQLWQIESLPELPPFVQAFGAAGLSSFLAFPLKTQQETIGSLNLWGNSDNSLTTEQLAIAQEVADQLAVAIQQYYLQQQLVRYTTELEERVAERTLELQQSNAELEAFSYTVSHDLKAPLRAMQGFANALLEDCGEQLDELGHEYAQRIIKATQRLDRLILDLLGYSRLGRAELQLKPVSLGAVVAEAIEQLEGEIKNTEAKIQVATKGIAPLPRILGHRATLIQVVCNLLSNAIKFVPDRVQPRIEVWAEERSEDSGQIWVRLWVEDNGLGIKPEYQEQVWRVFERLHGRESYPGSGIGLAIVRKGMERMGGRSGVESSLKRGSRFWLEGQTLTKEQSDG